MNKKAKITTLILGIILGILLTICFINIKYKQPGSKASRISIKLRSQQSLEQTLMLILEFVLRFGKYLPKDQELHQPAI